jgi:GNAT superfamily N-acetyltransferase
MPRTLVQRLPGDRSPAGSFVRVDRTLYRFEPATPRTADDLERFSGAHGKFRYCSCQRWRLPSAQYRDAGRDGRAAALDAAVRTGQPVGVLAYLGDDVVGWCSVAPRRSYHAVLASRVIPAIPGDDIWSVVCFFLAPPFRRRGLAPLLLEAACAYAAESGAAALEAYPWPGGSSYRFMGTRGMYLAAGFQDVPVPSGRRPVMRRPCDGSGIPAWSVTG